MQEAFFICFMFYIYNPTFFLNNKIMRKQKVIRDNERFLCVIKKIRLNLRFFKDSWLEYTHNIKFVKKNKKFSKEVDKSEKNNHQLRSRYNT
jgi:hypothetical protein